MEARCPFKKYNKTFLGKLKDISEHKQTKQAYEYHQRQQQIMERMASLEHKIERTDSEDYKTVESVRRELDLLVGELREMMQVWEGRAEQLERTMEVEYREEAFEPMDS